MIPLDKYKIKFLDRKYENQFLFDDWKVNRKKFFLLTFFWSATLLFYIFFDYYFLIDGALSLNNVDTTKFMFYTNLHYTIMLITIIVNVLIYFLSNELQFKYAYLIISYTFVLNYLAIHIRAYLIGISGNLPTMYEIFPSIIMTYLFSVIQLYGLLKLNFIRTLVIYIITCFPFLVWYNIFLNISIYEIIIFHLSATYFIIYNYYKSEVNNRIVFYNKNKIESSEKLMNLTLKKYFGEELSKEIINNDGFLKGQNKWVAISFTDIASYSNIIEKMSPKVALDFLNEYYSEMSKVINDHNGIILNYIGDCVMVVYGAPNDINDPEIFAVKAAIKMRMKLEKLNQKWDNNEFSRYWKNIGIDKISFRTGIHSGNLIVGNIGSSGMLQYSAIGDSVNIAARLEKINKDFNTTIAISDDVYSALTKEFTDKIDYKGEINLKGKTKKTKVYSL